MSWLVIYGPAKASTLSWSATKSVSMRPSYIIAVTSRHIEAITQALKAGASKASVCRTFGIKRTTLYDALKKAG